MYQTITLVKKPKTRRMEGAGQQRFNDFYPIFDNSKDNLGINNSVKKTADGITSNSNLIINHAKQKKWTIKLIDRGKGNDDVPKEVKRNGAVIRKYYKMRHVLFSKYDDGIQLDEESWYSVTPESIAQKHAKRLKCDVIIDGFCGVGGNSIQFAMTCKKVISIDIDARKIEMAKNNAKIYGVDHKIEFIVGDFFQVAPTLKADAVFLSPPWGGPEYAYRDFFDLDRDLQPKPLKLLLSVARKITNNLALFLPRNSNRRQITTAIGITGCEIEQSLLRWNRKNKVIAITVYTGKFKQFKNY